MPVQPFPKGYPRVIPYLVVSGALKAIEFYTKVLGATERMRMDGPGGKIMHAELQVGESVIMLADEMPDCGVKGPAAFGGSPVSILMYVADVDAVFKKALAAGAKEVRPVSNQFYGDRAGSLTDPFGHTWTLSTHVEDVSSEELQKRVTAMHKQPG